MKMISDARRSSSYVEILFEDGSRGSVPHLGMELLDWNANSLVFADRYGVTVQDGTGRHVGTIGFSSGYERVRAVGETIVITSGSYCYTFSRTGSPLRTDSR